MGAAERTVRSSVTAGESGAPSQSNLARCFARSEEHTSEFQSRLHLVCRLLLEKKKIRLYAHVALHNSGGGQHHAPPPMTDVALPVMIHQHLDLVTTLLQLVHDLVIAALGSHN